MKTVDNSSGFRNYQGLAWALLSLALVFGAVFYVCDRTPYLSDDYHYMKEFYRLAPLPTGATPTWESFLSAPSKFSHLVDETKFHYRIENGRFLTAFVERLMTGMPRWCFALSTAVAFVLLIVLTAGLLDVRRRTGLYAAGLFAVACADHSVAWLAGIVNYLYAAVFVLLGVRLFLCPRLDESCFRFRNWLFLLLLPLGFVLAGGHEQLSIAVCLTMGIYWLNEWFAKRRFSVSGRLLMSVGFGLGALAVVFAPSTLARASETGLAVPEISTLFSVVRKVKCIYRFCLDNPAFPVALVASLGFVFSRTWRARFDARARWILLFGWMLLLVTCLLTDGKGRTGWFMCVASVMMTVVAARELPFFDRKGVRRAIAAIVVLASLGVGLVTVCRTQHKAVRHEQDVAALKASPNLLIEYRADCVRPIALSWFDRSYGYLFTRGRPRKWFGIETARFNGLPTCIALPRDEIAFFSRPDLPDCLKKFALPHCPEWAEVPGADLIFSRCEDPEFQKPGRLVYARPTYAKGAPLKRDLRWLWRRLARPDWAEFSYASPEDEMASNRELAGFVIETPTGFYRVLEHNHFIPRSSLLKLEQFVPDDENED